jgi:hypothetical protein
MTSTQSRPTAADAGIARRLASRVNPNAVLAVVAVAQFMVILDINTPSVNTLPAWP